MEESSTVHSLVHPGMDISADDRFHIANFSSLPTAMEYTVDSGAFDYLWDVFLIPSFSRTAISLFLHGAGIYIILFLLSLYTLSRRKTAGTALLMVASCIMAVAANVQIAIELAMYRCFVIWGSQTWPLILPVLLMLSILVVGVLDLTGTVDEHGDLLIITLSVATNLAITVLTAGRILYIQRAASHVALDGQIRGRYTRAAVMILESGAIYCAVAIFMAITNSLNGEIFVIGSALGARVLNIIPTFTLVYVGLKNMRDSPCAESASYKYVCLPSTSVARPGRLLRRSTCPGVLDIKMEAIEGKRKDVGV
ncbi:hypothetical protein K438DRAFT_2028283 [Mycena galopus ATCC 62051]|nr:hypothetical protein K438DRAFT_2028283 [Mycena galopus ATCC 62051]